jgi:hypothetical protein
MRVHLSKYSLDVYGVTNFCFCCICDKYRLESCKPVTLVLCVLYYSNKHCGLQSCYKNVLKKKRNWKERRWKLNTGCPCHRWACYQLSCHGENDGTCFNKACQLVVKKLQNKILCYKETVECRHITFWPGSHGRVRCHTVSWNQIGGFSIDEVPMEICHDKKVTQV